ncbi:MAG TPA: hypothetical protein VMX57_02615 [Planctomycetota bacterium]|nr:hypothetical protein [Planctomycetota bacterium]
MDPMRLGRAVVLVMGVVAVLIVLFLVFMVWRTAWNARRRGRRAARGERELAAKRALPPVAPGVCGRCGGPFEAVYHLPDGRRLCPACYAVDIGPREGYDEKDGTSRSEVTGRGESHGPGAHA